MTNLYRRCLRRMHLTKALSAAGEWGPRAGYFPCFLLQVAALPWLRRRRYPPALFDLALRALTNPNDLLSRLPDAVSLRSLPFSSCYGRPDKTVREYLLFSADSCDVHTEHLCTSCYTTWKRLYAKCFHYGEGSLDCGPLLLMKVFELWQISGDDRVRTFVWLCDNHYRSAMTDPLDRENTILCGEADAPLYILNSHLSELSGKRRKERNKVLLLHRRCHHGSTLTSRLLLLLDRCASIVQS